MAFFITNDNKLYSTDLDSFNSYGFESISSSLGLFYLNNQARDISRYSSGIIVLQPGGAVLGIGDNSCGQLSVDFPETSYNTPQSLPTPVYSSHIKQVVPGNTTTMLTDTGDVWIWGDNYHNGSFIDRTDRKLRLTLLNTPEKIVYTAHDNYNIFVIGESGKVYVKGLNTEGVCGLGNIGKIATFTEIPGLSNVVQVASGDVYVLFVLQNGDLYGTGHGPYLGLGPTPVTYYSPTKLSLTNVKEVSISSNNTLSSAAVCNNGDVYRWGQFGYYDGTKTDLIDITTPEKVNIPPVKTIYAYGREYPYQSITYLTDDGNAYVEGHGDNFGRRVNRLIPEYFNTPVCIGDYYPELKGTIAHIENDYRYIPAIPTDPGDVKDPYTIPEGFLMYIDPVEAYTSGNDIKLVLNIKTDGNHSNPDNLIKYRVVKQTPYDISGNTNITELVPYQYTYQFYDKIEISATIDDHKNITSVYIESESGNNHITAHLYDRCLTLINKIPE